LKALAWARCGMRGRGAWRDRRWGNNPMAKVKRGARRKMDITSDIL
jgi:hypothetical protein